MAFVTVTPPYTISARLPPALATASAVWPYRGVGGRPLGAASIQRIVSVWRIWRAVCGDFRGGGGGGGVCAVVCAVVCVRWCVP